MADDFAQLAASFLPKSFGKNTTTKPVEKRPALQAKEHEEQDGPEVDMTDVKLPITNEAKIEQHSKTVSCVAVDQSGARLVTGGYDCNIGYYDFCGMDATLQPFRYVNPDEAHKIKTLRFSNCSQWLLCATSSNMATLLDRNGSKIRNYTDGDPYLRDLKNTNGHIAALTTCYWNPVNPDNFLTASEDGTVRIWNIGYRKRQDYVLVVKSKKAGAARTTVTHARYNHNASMIVTGSQDGSLKLWSGKGPWTFPSLEITDAHNFGSEITCLSFDQSTHNLLASRATDDTVKLWDLRNFKQPVSIARGLPNFCAETACVFSPDDGLICTGTSAKKGDELGQLVFLDAHRGLERVHSMDLTRSSVVGLAWPASLNQIITGNGDGTASLLYDPDVSMKGALLAVNRPARTREPAVISDVVVGQVLTPHALPLFRDNEGRSLKRAKIKARKDPVKSHLPTLPIDGPGQGGRLGSGVTQAIMAGRLPSKSTRDEDPREALLKYAKIAEENPIYVTPAYSQTQPKPVLDESLLVKEAEAERKKKEARNTN